MAGPSQLFPVGVSSEVSSPGSVLSVESGAPDLVLTCLQMLASAPFQVDGASFWLVVGHPLWVSPLNSQAAFDLQSDDAFCHIFRGGVFAGLASPLAPRDFVSFFTPTELIGVFGKVVLPENVIACWSSQVQPLPFRQLRQRTSRNFLRALLDSRTVSDRGLPHGS